MSAGTIDHTMTHVLLYAQRANLQALIACLSVLPEEHRASARSGAIQALGALEDTLGVVRTFPKRDGRRLEHDLVHLQRVVD